MKCSTGISSNASCSTVQSPYSQTSFSLVQFVNAPCPMYLTLLGICTFLRPAHPENAPFPMCFNPSGSSNLISRP